MTRADWMLLLAAVLCLPLLYARFWEPQGPASQLLVQTGGDEPRMLALYPDRQLHIQGPLGESIIEIREGRGRFLHSPCNGQVCVHTGWLSAAGELAACLPNRISIQLLGGPARFDAINF